MDNNGCQLKASENLEIIEEKNLDVVKNDEEKMEDIIALCFGAFQEFSSDASEKKKMQIELEHKHKQEELKVANESHKRNMLFAGLALSFLSAIVTTALLVGEAEIAKDFLYIILSAMGGAGLVKVIKDK
ncbi:hypothetical protein AB4211_08605 [Vibrio lentus]